MNYKNKTIDLLLLFEIVLILWNFPNLENFYELFYSSDHFYLTALFQDFAWNPQEISKWNLPPAPTFFPDAFIYLISFTLSFGKILHSIQLYNILYGFLLCLFSIKILNRMLPQNINSNKKIFLIFFLAFLILINLTKSNHFFLPLFLTGHHGGSLLIALFVIYAIFKMDFTIKTKYILPSVLFLLFFRWNDGLFLTVFTIPFLLTTITLSFFYTRFRKNLLVPYLIIFGLSIALHKTKNILISGIINVPDYQPEKLICDGIKSLGLPRDLLLNDLILLSKTLDFYEACIIIIAIISFLSVSIFMLVSIKKQNKRKNTDLNISSDPGSPRIDSIYEKNHTLSNSFFLIFILYSTSIQLISILLIQYTFSKELLLANRYYGSIFYFCFLMIPFGILFFLTSYNKLTKFFNLNVLVKFHIQNILSILLILIGIVSLGTSNYKTYQNPILECINKNPELEMLRDNSYGVADYWQSKPITVLSKHKIQVQPIQNIQAYEWVGRNRILQDGDPFQFAILGKASRIDETSFLSKYGKPDQEVPCSEFKIFIYKESKDF